MTTLTYYVDANVFLRYLLQDNQEMAQKAENYLHRAEAGELKLRLIPEVLLEINYVLLKIYEISRAETAQYLFTILSSPYLEMENKHLYLQAIKYYQTHLSDLTDIILVWHAKENEAKLLTFDINAQKIVID